eukprot:6204780-Pleurochrysis_carterae.AAC.1
MAGKGESLSKCTWMGRRCLNSGSQKHCIRIGMRERERVGAFLRIRCREQPPVRCRRQLISKGTTRAFVQRTRRTLLRAGVLFAYSQ